MFVEFPDEIVATALSRLGPAKARPDAAGGSQDKPIPGLAGAPAALTVTRSEAHDALIVTKSRPGFDEPTAEALARLVAAVAGGELAGLKYLVIDFAHGDAAGAPPPPRLAELNAAIEELILRAPVITIAWARSVMAGGDLDVALNCSILAAQDRACFSFAGDPMRLFGLYAALARKIGFVKTERLIESGRLLSAEEMRDLCLARDVIAAGEGAAPIEAYLQGCARRHNASQAIFRAQRLAMPPIERDDRLFGAALVQPDSRMRAAPSAAATPDDARPRASAGRARQFAGAETRLGASGFIAPRIPENRRASFGRDRRRDWAFPAPRRARATPR